MNTTTATNPPQGGNPVDQSVPLAQAETTEEISFPERGFPKGGVLARTRVTVQKCPRGFQSRLGYHAKLYIKIPNDVEREIGYITAWRISKPTEVNRKVDFDPSRKDWYSRDLGAYDDQDIHMARCYRALYGETFIFFSSFPPSPKKVSNQVEDEEKKKELRASGNEIVYIQTIYIKWREDPSDKETEYSGRVLAPIYLSHYYRLLGAKILPAWYSLKGPVTYLLEPRLQWESQINEYWYTLQKEEGYSDRELEEEVARRLSRVFQSVEDDYKYVPYVINERDVGGPPAITILGRVVDEAASTSLPEDRLILPPAS